MPYRRKYKKRGKGPFNDKTCLITANKAWALAKWLKERINAEKKVFDNTVTATPDTSGAVTHLSAIADGITENERVGLSIKSVALNVKGSANLHVSATSTYLRAIYFVDLQQVSDTSPGVTDVLQSASVNSFLNPDTFGRFKILSDRRYKLNTDQPNVLHSLNKKLNHHIRFNGTLGSDIQKGGLYLLTISSEAANTPTYSTQCRVRYYDN